MVQHLSRALSFANVHATHHISKNQEYIYSVCVSVCMGVVHMFHNVNEGQMITRWSWFSLSTICVGPGDQTQVLGLMASVYPLSPFH